jgi:hypothetical protein
MKILDLKQKPTKTQSAFVCWKKKGKIDNSKQNCDAKLKHHEDSFSDT